MLAMACERMRRTRISRFRKARSSWRCRRRCARTIKHWFAAHLHLPVRYYGKTYQTIRTKEWFLAHYATVIGPELKAAILAQDPETYLKNYQGLMVGEGSRNIWLEDFGDPGAGIPSSYEIITINNAK